MPATSTSEKPNNRAPAGRTRSAALALGALMAGVPALAAQSTTGNDGAASVRAFSCPAADSVLGPLRKFANMELQGGDRAFTTFSWPVGPFTVHSDNPFAIAEVDAMGPPAEHPSIRLTLFLSGTALANYIHSPPPHEIRLVVDRKTHLGPFPAGQRPGSADSASRLTVGVIVQGNDAIRLAAGHMARVEMRGMEIDLDSKFMDAVNSYYRASVCGLAAGPHGP